MKKTLLITLEWPPVKGGVGRYLSDFCDELPADQLIVLTNKTKEGPVKTGYKVYRQDLITKWPIWPKWLGLIWRVSRLVKEEKIEIIQVSHILPIGTVAYLIKKWLKIPYLVYIHGMDILLVQKPARKLKMAKKILKDAQAVVVNSRYSKGLVAGLGVGEEKIRVISPSTKIYKQKPNLELVSQLRQKYELQDKKIIFSVGRLVERKGFDLVVKALSAILKEVPEAIYLLAGVGPFESRIKELITELNLGNKVILLGEIKEEELASFYELADLFIMPSLELKAKGDTEGFGIVFLEANAFGKPVIGTKVGGIPDAVIDGETGLLIEPNNIEEISRTVIKLLRDNGLAQRLGSQGQKRVLRDFNCLTQAKKIEELLC